MLFKCSYVAERFFLRGFTFHDIHQQQSEFEQFGLLRLLKNAKKICEGKIYLRSRTFGAEVHKSNIRVWHNSEFDDLTP